MTFWVAGAVVTGAVVGGLSANSAANTQADAQKQASQTQMEMFNKINAQEQPFMTAGYGATDSLSRMLGLSGDKSAADYGSLTRSFSPQDFKNNLDPGYQFQLDTGAAAVRNADTPGVGALSGAALKDLMGFNQSMAATGYQNAFNRFQTQQNNVFTRLSDIANRGQNAASNTGQAGTALGTGVAQSQAAAGGSLAAGQIGVGNAISGGANSLAGLMYINANNGSAGGYSNQYGTAGTGTLKGSDGYTQTYPVIPVGGS